MNTHSIFSTIVDGRNVLYRFTCVLWTLLAAACAIPVGQGTVPPDYIVLTDYNLQTYVPIPIEGEIPVKTRPGRRDVEVSVIWKDAAGQAIPGSAFNAFISGAVYRAEITLAAKTGYIFNPQMPFVYPERTVESQKSGDNNHTLKRTIEVVYMPTAIRPAATMPIPDSFVKALVDLFGSSIDDEGSAIKAMNDNKDKSGLFIEISYLPSHTTEDLAGGGVLLLQGNSPPAVVIEGNGRKVRLMTTRSVLTVGPGVTLTLRNMTLIGYSANTAEMIKITKGGTVILENVTIQDNTVVKGTAPGAVSIDGGTLIMKNGVITNNIGGPASIFLVGAIGIPISLTTQPASGIHVSSGGIFEMTGGTIDVNSRTEDNKIVCAVFIGNGFFNMYGGSISNNRKNGVGLVDGIFNMYGGTIAGNTLTGVALFYAGTGIFAMYGDATVPPSSDKRTNDVLTTYPNSGGIARPVYIGSPLTGSAPVANITGGGIVEGNLSNENKAKLLIGGNPWL